MKIRYNRFAVFPVMCHDCHRYIWMEPYRRADVWHNLLDRYVKKTICNECLKKYDVGGKQRDIKYTMRKIRKRELWRSA